MWWSRSRTGIALALAALLVAGCGFRPLYGGGYSSEAAAELASIRIDPIEDRVGQDLHNQLLDRLTPQGRPVQPQYALRINLSENTKLYAFSRQEFATRANLTLTASYQLTDLRTRQVVLRDHRVVISGYNAVRADFAALANEKDARARAVQELADEIRNRLSVFFVQRRDGDGSPAP